jgi:hypothetical protein
MSIQTNETKKVFDRIKNGMSLKIFTTLILIFFTLSFISNSALADFHPPHIRSLNSCQNISLNFERSLNAICFTRDNQPQFSSLDLNRYIANSNGNLRWEDREGNQHIGNFISSCSNPFLIGTLFSAICLTLNNNQVMSGIDLNDRIVSSDGFLTYQRRTHDEL